MTAGLVGPGMTAARRIADAVLYEGYVLYPYRASSAKNRVRWQFGVVGPAGAPSGAGEPASLHTECLVEGPGSVAVTLRFLQVQDRTVERADGDGFVPVDELQVGDARWTSWQEAVEREVEIHGAVPTPEPTAVDVDVPGGTDVELLTDGDTVVGRLVRTRSPLRGVLETSAVRVPVDGGRDLRRLRVGMCNLADWAPGPRTGSREADRAADRDLAGLLSFVGTHLLLAVTSGAFVSLLDPPDWATEAAAACSSARCWPVLAGPEGSRDVVLAAPIILYDHPAVAAESPGEFFDNTEIDELLTLRVMTLTDDEKQAARGTDPKAAAIVRRCDEMSDDALASLHGTRRDPVPDTGTVPVFSDVPAGTPWWDPGVDASVAPDRDAVRIGGVDVAKGSRVRLCPRRRADAQDLFLAGAVGVVTAVYHDVDGGTHVAIVLEDDPAADLHEWYGRFYYFAPDELEPLGSRPAVSP